MTLSVTFSIRIMTGDTPLGILGPCREVFLPCKEICQATPDLLPAGSTGESLVEHALLIFSALGLVGFAMVDHNAGMGFFLAIFDMCLIFFETRM